MDRPDIIVGVAFGVGSEPSAIIVLERVERLTDQFDRRRRRWNTTLSYRVPELERCAREARYPDVVAALKRLDARIRAIKPARLSLVADITKAGWPVVLLMRAQDLRPLPVVIGEAQGARAGRGILQMPAREIVSTLSIVLGDRRLQVAEAHPEAQALLSELQAFRLKSQTDAAASTSLVTAAGIGCWWGEHQLRSIAHQPPPPRTAPEMPPPPTVDELVKRQGSRQNRRSRI